ncbi:MAG: hypothetical protein WC533_04405 [Candidatus Pacearchaeota archaeon]
MLPNYEQLVDKIARASGLTTEEVIRKVEAKCAKLSGLISKEGSAQIVASELGISFEKEKVKISELYSGMKKANLIGKIIQLNSPKDFVSKSGNTGKVLSMTIADDTGNIRTVLWDTNHIALFETNRLSLGDVVEISNASVRNDELHLGGFSDIKISRELVENVQTERKIPKKNISELKPGESVKIRGFIVQIFEPRFFEVCPECKKKVVDGNCHEHGSVIPEKRALVGIVLDDGSGSIRGVVFGEQIKEIGFSDEEINSPDIFMNKKLELIGKEAYFCANVRNNNLFNTTELMINKVEEIDLDKLIEVLGK